MKFISQLFLSEKEWLAPHEMRYHLLNKYIFTYSLCGHALFIPIFYFLGKDIPFYNNLLCIMIDVFCLYMNSKWRHKTVYVLFAAEIIYHTFFSSIIFGSGTGFVFYYLSISFYIFLFARYKLLRMIMASVVVVFFIAQYVYLASAGAEYPLSVIPVWLIYFFNCAANFLAIAFVAVYFSIFVDIAESAIIRAKEKAEEGERAKSLFLANMSHEIRSPLNSIVGMINLSQLSDDEYKKQEYLCIARDSADHLLTVINDILDYSKIEVSRLSLNSEVFNVHHLVRNTMMAMDSSIYKKNLEMKYEISDTVPVNVAGDPSRIRQVLINLLSNAIKFTERGEIILRCKNNSVDDDRCALEFTVEDTGAGIPEDKLGIIFDRFTQLDGKTGAVYTGTGLGLAISRELVELMGGTIRVESRTGSGSLFSFTIPLLKAEPEAKSIVLKSQAVNHERRTDLKILIAEDMFTCWLLYEKYMLMLGHSFKIVENGFMVLDELERDTYDLVLMDIEMPEMGGEETLSLIRSGVRGGDRNIPVIALTGYAGEDLYKCGFNGCVTKPVELYDLDRAINEAVCDKLNTGNKD